MRKRLMLLSVLCSIFLGASVSFAQFPNVKGMLGGNKSGGSTVSISDLSGSNEKAISVYLASTQELAQSLEKAAEAFGVKQEVLEKLAVVQSLKEGNINDNDLEKARKASADVQLIIKQKMQETKAPSVESKKLMAESIVHLAVGIQKDSELVIIVKDLSSQAQGAVGSASPMDIMKVKNIASTALVLTKAIPMDLKLTKDILSSYVQYAKANNIAVPDNATGLLKGE